KGSSTSLPKDAIDKKAMASVCLLPTALCLPNFHPRLFAQGRLRPIFKLCHHLIAIAFALLHPCVRKLLFPSFYRFQWCHGTFFISPENQVMFHTRFAIFPA